MIHRLLQIKAFAILLLGAALASGQTNRGEVRLKITDPSGATLRAAVELISLGTGYDKTFHSDTYGSIAIQLLPYGVYKLEVQQPGFAPYSETQSKSAPPYRLRSEFACRSRQ